MEKYKNYLIAFLIFVIVILISAIIYSHAPVLPQSQNMSMQMMSGVPVMVTKTLKTFDVPSSEITPTIHFTIQKNKTDGWNLHIITTNFTFTPDKVDTAPKPGIGHVHLYIDGVLYVVYSPWYFIGDLPKGMHTIRVALANNDHSVYAKNGKYIDSTQMIDVK